MLSSQIIEMLMIQDRLNKMIDPDWLTAGHSWGRAIMVESVELMDEVGWKWWKARPEINLHHTALEISDIWHFVLSDTLVKAKGNIQEATLVIKRGCLGATEYQERIADEPFPGVYIDFGKLPLARRIEVFGCQAGLTGEVDIPMLFDIAKELGISGLDLYHSYLIKNSLNIFRQENGYKDGTYIKDWNGREDNEVLYDIAFGAETMSLQRLMGGLTEAYAEVLATQKK